MPDKTQWSLPGPADAPQGRDLKMQLEVYGETILLRGFEDDSNWVQDRLGGRDRQRVHPAPGILLGAAAPGDALWWNQGETGQVVALWRPPQVWSVALQREAFKPPARLRLPMPGLVFVCSPGRAPWVYAAAWNGPPTPSSSLFRAPAFNVFRDGRVCPGSHRFPEEVGPDTGVLLPVLLLPYRRHPGPLEEAPRQPASAMGGDRWNRLNTRWKTWFPSARWARRWRSPRGDVATATASDAPGPVGYLVNHPGGLAGMSRGSATTTFSDRAASTSSPRALT